MILNNSLQELSKLIDKVWFMHDNTNVRQTQLSHIP